MEWCRITLSCLNYFVRYTQAVAYNCLFHYCITSSCTNIPHSIYLLKIFLLQLTSILYSVQVQNTVIRHLYNLLNDPPDKSSAHLAPCIVLTILLTVFPMLHLRPRDCFVTAKLNFLIPSPFSPSPPTLLSSGNHQSVLCIYESISGFGSFILLFWFNLKVKSYGICLSLSDLFHLV